jgi:hypothetical protein
MVAESYRDYNLKYINLMLLDIAGGRKVGPDAILAGYCPELPVDLRATCMNQTGKNKGISPIAWGRAQDAMMMGGWGRNQGANSPFGQNYEASLVMEWLGYKQSGAKVTTTCSATPPTDKDPDRVRVDKLFESLVGK